MTRRVADDLAAGAVDLDPLVHDLMRVAFPEEA
jgi:hypothetical protein